MDIKSQEFKKWVKIRCCVGYNIDVPEYFSSTKSTCKKGRKKKKKKRNSVIWILGYVHLLEETVMP